MQVNGQRQAEGKRTHGSVETAFRQYRRVDAADQRAQLGQRLAAGCARLGQQLTLTTSRGAVGATAIAEYVMAAASYFARGLQEGTQQKQDGVFTTDGYELISLRRATMGVLGLGGIGQEVARLSRAVGMRVIGTRRSAGAPATDTDGANLVLPADQILQVAAESDFLAVCSQLTPRDPRPGRRPGLRGDEARGGAHQHRPWRAGR